MCWKVCSAKAVQLFFLKKSFGRYPHQEKIKLDSYFTQYEKVNSKGMRDLNVKVENVTIKNFEENTW